MKKNKKDTIIAAIILVIGEAAIFGGMILAMIGNGYITL